MTLDSGRNQPGKCSLKQCVCVYGAFVLPVSIMINACIVFMYVSTVLAKTSEQQQH